jgi:hypothetical protein
MIKLELSEKALRFTLEALNGEISNREMRLTDAALGENERADIGNDTALLRAVQKDFARSLENWDSVEPLPGDARLRAKLGLIIQCLYCDGFSEKEQESLIAWGCRASPDPAWTDYIYWPMRFGLDGSIEAALDRVFSYQAINLPRSE